jgi:hypothetical protein
VTPANRSTPLFALLGILLAVVVACSPTAGPLGTPNSPAVSADPSDEPPPSDAAPESPSATPSAPASPSGEPSGSPDGSAPPTATPAPSATAAAGTTIVRAYFVLGSFTNNEGLVPVLREIPETRGVARAAMVALLAGPKGAEVESRPALYTAIPDGTRLLGIDIDGRTATVDLSGEFASGGGSYSVLARLAQVVYTLTQFSTVDRVLFELDGEPVTTFSSEGVILDGPVNRADYRDLLPAIFLDRPAWGAAGGNPMRISGIANVFEASFMAQVLDAKGNLLVEQPVAATCGTGCWGTFKADLAYDVSKAQYGTLRVFEPSAKDGSPIKVTEYRVWLTP